jgi:multimeric flavodoxin WrbA
MICLYESNCYQRKSEKKFNTATLLQKALEGAKSVGADTEIIHLYDLNFKGCTSCFACKRKGSSHIGHCVMKDDLTSVLEKIVECDVLLLGTPIYFANITGCNAILFGTSFIFEPQL